MEYKWLIVDCEGNVMEFEVPLSLKKTLNEIIEENKQNAKRTKNLRELDKTINDYIKKYKKAR